MTRTEPERLVPDANQLRFLQELDDVRTHFLELKKRGLGPTANPIIVDEYLYFPFERGEIRWFIVVGPMTPTGNITRVEDRIPDTHPTDMRFTHAVANNLAWLHKSVMAYVRSHPL